MSAVSNFVRVGCETLLTPTVIYVKAPKWRHCRFFLAPTPMYMKTSIADIAEAATLSV